MKKKLETLEDAIKLMKEAQLPKDQRRAVDRIIMALRYSRNEAAELWHRYNPDDMGR